MSDDIIAEVPVKTQYIGAVRPDGTTRTPAEMLGIKVADVRAQPREPETYPTPAAAMAALNANRGPF